jgi:DNA-binding transcriptional ArsR family regulator
MDQKDISHFGASDRVSKGALPLELAQALSPALEKALGNSIRRDILRTLQEAELPMSLSEVATYLVESEVRTLNYHLTVLVGSGEVATQGDSPGRYVSTVADDPQAQTVLQATRRRDAEGRRTSVRGSSSSWPEMFRGAPTEHHDPPEEEQTPAP